MAVTAAGLLNRERNEKDALQELKEYRVSKHNVALEMELLSVWGVIPFPERPSDPGHVTKP